MLEAAMGPVGEVASVRQSPVDFLPPHGRSGSAQFSLLDLTWAPGSRGDGPEHLLLKAGVPERFDDNVREIAFFEATGGSPQIATTRYYGSGIDHATRTTALLLEDHSADRHHRFAWPVPPRFEACESGIRALSELHAAWWNAPELARPEFERVDAARVQHLVSLLTPAWEQFRSVMADRVSPARRQLYDRWLSRYPSLLAARLDGASDLTLVHGDAHFWNMLIPRDDAEPTLLIDWQLWGADHGTWDLAYCLALHWYPERRARFEAALLETWLAGINRAGIRYTRSQLDHDYRLMMLRLLAVPVMQHALGTPASIWWPHMDRAFNAVESSDCLDLLE